MKRFPTHKINSVPADDEGVSVHDALKLLEGSKYYQDIYDALGVEHSLDDFIKIPGAGYLVKRIYADRNNFIKFDIKAQYQNLKFRHIHDGDKTDPDLEVQFTGRTDIRFPTNIAQSVREEIEQDDVRATPRYSAQHDLLNSLFGMFRYSDELATKALRHIVLRNLEMLEEAFINEENSHLKHEKWYRLLKDKNGEYHFRALVTDQYRDYNIAVSVFITLFAMHRVIKAGETGFAVKSFNYNESEIDVIFEDDSEGISVPKVGVVTFQLHLSNSEIAEGAVKLNIISRIVSKVDDKGPEVAIYFQSKQGPTLTVTSISHGMKPQTAVNSMNLSEKLSKSRGELQKDIEAIASRSPRVILARFRAKIVHSHTFGVTSKERLLKLLPVELKVDAYHDLLRIMGDAQEVIGDDDIDVVEHLRNIAYSALTGKQ
ncbi:hypothetical protein [Hymenobacter cheonanensis]|uniref:hypothetical protein n=1 Tax=Hymenobacter sp. CA2-7 TaxID=3063993 RepID=UPI002713DA15|nr:hypothetical protein [Hymenobacter sp. CA2-7]MDO7886813.1 hypothetical protein [Hymenobacter sp. CA2-7]